MLVGLENPLPSLPRRRGVGIWLRAESVHTTAGVRSGVRSGPVRAVVSGTALRPNK